MEARRRNPLIWRSTLVLLVPLLAIPARAQLVEVAFTNADSIERVLHVQANSGALLTPPGGVNTIANCCSFPGSLSAHDAAGRRVFFIGIDTNTASTRIYVINADTGATITSPALPVHNYDYIEYVSPNVYVVYHDVAADFEFRLATVNTTTGALTNIGGVIGGTCCSPVPGVSAAGGGFFYFVSSQEGVNEPRIYTVSTATGAFQSNPLLPGATQYMAMLRHPINGSLYMLTKGAGGAQLVTVNPATGGLTNVGSATAGCCNAPNGPQFGYGGYFYFIGSNDVDPPKRFFRIHDRTGAIETFSLSTSYNYNVFEAVSFIFADGFAAGNTGAWSSDFP
jgi:hypothetical protein